MIEKRPFVNYTLDQDKPDTKNIFTIRLNDEQRKELDAAKKILQQKKDGTALKQLSKIGFIVLHDPKTAAIIELLFKNKKNNKLNMIDDFD